MLDYFTDKVFIVTGASSGLGLEISKELIRKKCQTVLFARDFSKVNITEIEPLREPLLIKGDVTKEKDVKRCIDSVAKKFNRIDGMVLSAGKSMWTKLIDLKHPREMQEILEINYWGVVNFCFYALPYLKKSSARVVTISSLQSIIGVPYHTGYTASKHALNGFIESLSLEEEISFLNVIASWVRGTSLRKNSLGYRGNNKHHSQNNTFSISVKDCAQKIVETIPSSKKIIYFPWFFSLLPLARYFFPNWIAGKVKKVIEKEALVNNH